MIFHYKNYFEFPTTTIILNFQVLGLTNSLYCDDKVRYLDKLTAIVYKYSFVWNMLYLSGISNKFS